MITFVRYVPVNVIASTVTAIVSTQPDMALTMVKAIFLQSSAKLSETHATATVTRLPEQMIIIHHIITADRKLI